MLARKPRYRETRGIRLIGLIPGCPIESGLSSSARRRGLPTSHLSDRSQLALESDRVGRTLRQRRVESEAE
jgi:hypothetical protein